MLYLYCSLPGTHSTLACAELDSASNRHLLMRAVASLCALAGFDSEFLSQYKYSARFLCTNLICSLQFCRIKIFYLLWIDTKVLVKEFVQLIEMRILENMFKGLDLMG